MPEPDGVKKLTGIARSIDTLFARLEGGGGAPAPTARALEVDTEVAAAPLDAAAPPPLPEVVELDIASPEVMDLGTLAPEPDDAAAPPPLPEVVDLGALADGDVFEVELVPVAEGHEGAEDAPAPPAAAPAPTGSAGGADDEDEEQPTELDMAVEAYIAGDLTQADEIERIGAEMLERRELDPIARGVVRLTVAAGEPPDRSLFAVARSIMDPVVLEHVVRRLGTERVEETRQEYYQAGRSIGEPMALALRDGLADTTTNRLARRNYCDALRAMGDVARPTIDAMAADENRFLCRNALTLLGEIGDERALELVTGQLGNPDTRVRREALRSLARIGNAESGAKLMELGLLDDSDDDVRIAAAVTAGELKIMRAVRPLVTMLEGTKDPDRAIPLIRALGQLEDPSAVSEIERFAVPSLFSRPRTDVRIAAYRALYHIGTPHAMKLLAKASSDKDAEVASAVLALRQSESRSAAAGEGDQEESAADA